MVWLLTAIYFVVWSGLHWFGFLLYGKSLIRLGKAGGAAKNIGGLIVYAIFSCVLVAPLFIAFELIEEWRHWFNTSAVYMLYFIGLFLLSFVPGGLYFKRRFLRNLKNIGYFSKS